MCVCVCVGGGGGGVGVWGDFDWGVVNSLAPPPLYYT